jgi:phosphopantetheinyl transferase (holo-ACP synthase)
MRQVAYSAYDKAEQFRTAIDSLLPTKSPVIKEVAITAMDKMTDYPTVGEIASRLVSDSPKERMTGKNDFKKYYTLQDRFAITEAANKAVSTVRKYGVTKKAIDAKMPSAAMDRVKLSADYLNRTNMKIDPMTGKVSGIDGGPIEHPVLAALFSTPFVQDTLKFKLEQDKLALEQRKLDQTGTLAKDQDAAQLAYLDKQFEYNRDLAYIKAGIDATSMQNEFTARAALMKSELQAKIANEGNPDVVKALNAAQDMADTSVKALNAALKPIIDTFTKKVAEKPRKTDKLMGQMTDAIEQFMESDYGKSLKASSEANGQKFENVLASILYGLTSVPSGDVSSALPFGNTAGGATSAPVSETGIPGVDFNSMKQFESLFK